MMFNYSLQRDLWHHFDKDLALFTMNPRSYAAPCPSSGAYLLVHFLMKRSVSRVTLDDAFKQSRMCLEHCRLSVNRKSNQLVDSLEDDMKSAYIELRALIPQTS